MRRLVQPYGISLLTTAGPVGTALSGFSAHASAVNCQLIGDILASNHIGGWPGSKTYLPSGVARSIFMSLASHAKPNRHSDCGVTW